MIIHEIGKQFNPGRTYQDNQIEYNYYDRGHELLLCLDAITNNELNAFKKGYLEFALYQHKTILMLIAKWFVFKTGYRQEVFSIDAGYNINLVSKDRRQIPPEIENENQKALITLYLVESSTGILRAMRAVTFSNEFSRELHNRIIKQSKNVHFDKDSHFSNVAYIQNNYKTNELWQAALIKCFAGE